MAPMPFPGAEATPLEPRLPGSWTQSSVRASGRLSLLGRLQGSSPRALAGWGLREGHPPGAPCCQQFPLWTKRTSRALNLEQHFTLPPASEIQSLNTTCQQDPRPGQDPESHLSSPQVGRLRGLWQRSLGLNFFL